LGAGAVIHAMHHEQSMSKYGGLRRKMPITTACYLLATLALVGFPGFSGFWSKDAILADALAFSMRHGHWFLPLAGFATVFLTAFYMFRQFFLTFTGRPRDPHAYDHAREAPWQMLVPLIVLGALAAIGGGFGQWFGGMNPARSGVEQVRSFQEAGFASSFVTQALQREQAEATQAAPRHERPESRQEEGHGPEAEARHKAHYAAMGLSTCLGLAGILLGALMYLQRRDGRTVFNPATVADRCRPVYRLLWNKYYLDEIYMACFVMSTRGLAWLTALFDRCVIDSVVNFCGFFGKAWSVLIEIFDRLVVDGVFVNGSARTTSFMGGKLSRTQTGLVRQYLILTAVGLLVISGLCAYVLYRH